MLSCKNLYEISKRLSITLGDVNQPFGGMNMILCGDFAQLPPVRAKALYSPDVGHLNTRATTKEQENTMGKAIWHQFTTVVILRENMRQWSQTREDIKFRAALENMRYKDCTSDDINLLHSLCSKSSPDKRKLEQARFRHVSIITSRNRYRDKINEIGTQKFAEKTNQKLVDLHSIDTLTTMGIRSKLGLKKGEKLPSADAQNKKGTNSAKQRVLWNLPPDMNDHKAGKLSLCLGMPVLIKKN
ncbi:hypothetical protein K439DRAFT_1312009, partial [Ramaria rubella]